MEHDVSTVASGAKLTLESKWAAASQPGFVPSIRNRNSKYSHTATYPIKIQPSTIIFRQL